jgi:hypothetical protein
MKLYRVLFEQGYTMVLADTFEDAINKACKSPQRSKNDVIGVNN